MRIFPAGLAARASGCEAGKRLMLLFSPFAAISNSFCVGKCVVELLFGFQLLIETTHMISDYSVIGAPAPGITVDFCSLSNPIERAFKIDMPRHALSNRL